MMNSSKSSLFGFPNGWSRWNRSIDVFDRITLLPSGSMGQSSEHCSMLLLMSRSGLESIESEHSASISIPPLCVDGMY